MKTSLIIVFSVFMLYFCSWFFVGNYTAFSDPENLYYLKKEILKEATGEIYVSNIINDELSSNYQYYTAPENYSVQYITSQESLDSLILSNKGQSSKISYLEFFFKNYSPFESTFTININELTFHGSNSISLKKRFIWLFFYWHEIERTKGAS